MDNAFEERLSVLIREYIATKSIDVETEGYDTPRGFAEGEMWSFISFLQSKGMDMRQLDIIYAGYYT